MDKSNQEFTKFLPKDHSDRIQFLLYKLSTAEKWHDLSREQRQEIRELRAQGKLPDDLIRKYYNLIYELDKEETEVKGIFTDEEIGFRRGFIHGIVAALNGVTYKEAMDWKRNSRANCFPPMHGEND